MSGFLAPINYGRARDVLKKLSGYAVYDEEGAGRVHAVLRDSYPLIFQKTDQKMFDRQALLIEMPGANVADPLVFVCHVDAHPCPKTDFLAEGRPMAAALERAHVVALLEALEALLSEGYRPGGDLLIALSMDGLSGGQGAAGMAAHMRARKVSPCFVLDFGGYATHSAFCTYLPKNAPLALIGISEKGLLTGGVQAQPVPLKTGEPGLPPLSALLRGGARLSRGTEKPSLCKSTEQMLVALGKRAPLLQRLLVAKPRLTFPLLRFLWRKRAIMRQFFMSQRTLTGMTAAGDGVNRPESAALSFRQTTIPGKKLSAWKHRLREKIADENLRMDIEIELEHSARSRTGGEAWDALETAIEILFDRAVIVPCLSPYVTDGRFYAGLKGNVYRFSPFLVTGEEALRGECVVTDGSLQTAVQFFRQMLSV